MAWTQVYDPLHSWILSTLVAALPILVLFGLLAGLRVKPHWCAIAGAGTAVLVAVGVFGMPFPLAGMSFLYGVAFGVLKIAWIVLAAGYLYDISVFTGQFEIMKESVAGITADRRLQLLLVAFCFGAFIEGAAGFGAPVAIAGAFMIGLGFRLERAESEADHEGARDRHRSAEAGRTLNKGAEAERHEQQLQAPVGRDARHRLLHDLELAGEDGNVVEVDRHQNDPGDFQHAEGDAVQKTHPRERQRHPEDADRDQDGRPGPGNRAPVRLHPQSGQEAEQDQDRESGDEGREDPAVQRVVNLGPRHSSLLARAGFGNVICENRAARSKKGPGQPV